MVKVNLLSHIHHSVEEMATHSSILAWRIPGMEEPSGLLSMGPHRVGHDWSNLAAAAAAAAAAAYITGKSNLFSICYTICLRKKHKNKQNSYEKKLISYRNKYREIQNSLWNVHLGRAKSKVKNALSLWTGLRFLLLAKVYQGSIILYKVSITTLSDRPCQHRFFLILSWESIYTGTSTCRALKEGLLKTCSSLKAKRTLAKTVQINSLRILEINYRFRGEKKRLNPSKNSECFAFKLTLIP